LLAATALAAAGSGCGGESHTLNEPHRPVINEPAQDTVNTPPDNVNTPPPDINTPPPDPSATASAAAGDGPPPDSLPHVKPPEPPKKAPAKPNEQHVNTPPK